MDILETLRRLRPNESISIPPGKEPTLSNVFWVGQRTYTPEQNVSHLNVIWNEHLDVYTEHPFSIPTQKECEEYWESTVKNEVALKRLRDGRNIVLSKTDKYAVTDWPHSNLEVQQSWFNERQTLRDLPTLASPLVDGSMKLWVTNQNGNLQSGDSVISSNISGYFTKGEPTLITIKDSCDFSESTTETYYSNIVSIVECPPGCSCSGLKDISETPKEGYTENAYWSSNTISYYTGNVISHYSNVVIYDGVNVYTNVQIEEYSNLEANVQSNFTAVTKSNTSPIEIEGYTPVLSYSNISSSQYNANVHTKFIKVVTHYANLSVSNCITYSNITPSAYEALNSNLIVTPAYTSFYHELSNTSIRVGAYAALTPEQRTEYTIQSVPAVTSNLQSFYTPQTKTTAHEIRYLDASGTLTDQANAVWKAAQVECTFPTS